MSTQKAADTLTDGLGSVTSSVDKVERIREIIFGAQSRDYAQKFENVQRELLRLNREVEQLNEQLREQEKSFKKQVREEAERLPNWREPNDVRQGLVFVLFVAFIAVEWVLRRAWGLV